MTNLRTKTSEIVYTKKGEVNKTFKNAIDSCKFNAETLRIYPVSYGGSGRHIVKRDFTSYITNLLTAQGYKFIKGNDAPRGGENGNYLQVSKKGFEFVLSIKNI